MVQSARHSSVEPNNSDTGSTLSLNDATYIPSPSYKDAGNDGVFGNFKASPRMDVMLKATASNGDNETAKLWLKAARNEGLSVQVPSANAITSAIRDRDREFSTYIPGLAGIPLSEERRATSIVLRQAAAGDANTVLRNVLLLLKQAEDAAIAHDEAPLSELTERVSAAIRGTEFRILFDDQSDYTISAQFKTAGMTDWRPLELAGIGFLQTIQIFAYIVFFKPRLLLIDEPDSHLHPDAQGRLIREIASASEKHDCQVILTTHSPSVMRALPDQANVIWMKDGTRVGNSDAARQQMGWGLLDKELVLLTEDQDTDMLRLLLGQWPELERRIAIWPLSGCGNLPKGAVLNSLQALFGNVRTLVHRDGDMMLDIEKEHWRKNWGLKPEQSWITQGADIESYFVCPNYCAAVMGVDQAQLEDRVFKVLNATASADNNDFKKKRKAAKELYPDGDATPGHADAFNDLSAKGIGFVRKKAINKLRSLIQKAYGGNQEANIGKVIPKGIELAPDLKRAIEAALQ
ncbi:hypothetical protein AKJ29_17035 [Aliiroseovarius crassostreae]|uniref:ATPase AAA-type core domain-containing protein n=2 Tax=Aliiroseovarius crassostreae TaxID=154981 RepID=A0A0P7KKC4_9RHOB|nr:hypothetical protein AKJ29_17035 [Aliiroseovarius crassostreae]